MWGPHFKFTYTLQLSILYPEGRAEGGDRTQGLMGESGWVKMERM